MEQETSPSANARASRYRSIAVVLLLALILGGWYFTRDASYRYQFAPGENVQNWDFQGAYTGKPDLEQRAREEVTRLEEHLGDETDTETDYAIYVSLANQYRLLGDGEGEFTQLKKALAIDSETTGLAWHNLGYLLAERGALRSARDAFARAAHAQPQILQYHTAYLEFLTENFKDESGVIEEAFGEAVAVAGDNSSLLEIQAHWLESVSRYADAIAAWEKVKILTPAAAPIVDGEIARLKAQL